MPTHTSDAANDVGWGGTQAPMWGSFQIKEKETTSRHSSKTFQNCTNHYPHLLVAVQLVGGVDWAEAAGKTECKEHRVQRRPDPPLPPPKNLQMTSRRPAVSPSLTLALLSTNCTRHPFLPPKFFLKFERKRNCKIENRQTPKWKIFFHFKDFHSIPFGHF